VAPPSRSRSSGRDDRFFPLEFQQRVIQKRLRIAPDVMPGGHLLALSRPTELADRLESFVTEIETSS
jgi:hypothetical protein